MSLFNLTNGCAVTWRRGSEHQRCCLDSIPALSFGGGYGPYDLLPRGHTFVVAVEWSNGWKDETELTFEAQAGKQYLLLTYELTPGESEEKAGVRRHTVIEETGGLLVCFGVNVSTCQPPHAAICSWHSVAAAGRATGTSRAFRALLFRMDSARRKWSCRRRRTAERWSTSLDRTCCLRAYTRTGYCCTYAERFTTAFVETETASLNAIHERHAARGTRNCYLNWEQDSISPFLCHLLRLTDRNASEISKKLLHHILDGPFRCHRKCSMAARFGTNSPPLFAMTSVLP